MILKLKQIFWFLGGGEIWGGGEQGNDDLRRGDWKGGGSEGGGGSRILPSHSGE